MLNARMSTDNQHVIIEGDASAVDMHGHKTTFAMSFVLTTEASGRLRMMMRSTEMAIERHWTRAGAEARGEPPRKKPYVRRQTKDYEAPGRPRQTKGHDPMPTPGRPLERHKK